MQLLLHSYPNLTIKASAVDDLITSTDSSSTKCRGVVTSDGSSVFATNVVITTGTFLRGEINVGLTNRPAGRMGDAPAVALAQTIERYGFAIGRLRTGTPPRLLKKTIDFSKTTMISGDNPPLPFSFMNDRPWIKPEDQMPCYITFTTPECAKIVTDTIHLNRHIKEETTGPR